MKKILSFITCIFTCFMFLEVVNADNIDYYYYDISVEDFVLCPLGTTSAHYYDSYGILTLASSQRQYCVFNLEPGYLLSTSIDMSAQRTKFDAVPCPKEMYCSADVDLKIYADITDNYEKYLYSNLEYDSSGNIKANVDISMRRCPSGWRDGVGISNLDSCEMDVEAGYYYNGTMIKECSAGYYCPAKTYTYGSEGPYNNNGTYSCPEGTTSSAGAKSVSDCISTNVCPDGWKDGGAQTDINECVKNITAGTYWSGSKIEECPKAYYCSSTSITYANKDKSSSNKTACPSGLTTTSTGYGSINNCSIDVEDGKYVVKLDGNSYTTKTCLEGYYCPGGTFSGTQIGGKNLTQCPTGTTSAAGAKSVSDCYVNVAAGKYIVKLDGNNYTTQTCLEGYYCPGGTFSGTQISAKGLVQCPSGTTSSAGAKSASDCKSANVCPDGWKDGGAQTDINNCSKNIAAGTYWNGSKTEDCPKGYYCLATSVKYENKNNSSNKNACPQSFDYATGAKSQSECKIKLSSGEYYNATDKKKKTCDKGSYCPGGIFSYKSGNIGITACPNGLTTTSTGYRSSADCFIKVDAGKYVIVTADGDYSLKSCSKGYYCESGTYFYSSSYTRGQTKCPTGTTSDANATKKSDCYVSLNEGKMFNVNNDTYSVVTCPEDYYCPGGNVKISTTNYGAVKCPDGYGTNGSEGATSESDCKKIDDYVEKKCSLGEEQVGNNCVKCTNSDGVKTFSSGCTISACKEGYTKTEGVCLKDDEDEAELVNVDVDTSKESKDDNKDTEATSKTNDDKKTTEQTKKKTEKENPKTGSITSGIAIIFLIGGGICLYKQSKKQKVFR